MPGGRDLSNVGNVIFMGTLNNEHFIVNLYLRSCKFRANLLNMRNQENKIVLTMSQRIRM